MSTLTQIQDLGVYLDSQTKESLSLKTLIQEQFIDLEIPTSLRLTITIAKNAHIVLADDLISFESLGNATLIKHTIELVVHENALVLYTMKVSPKTLTDSVITSENNNQTVISKEINLRLVGRHAEARVVCSCYANQNKVFTFKTLQEHCTEDTTSSLVIKSVLDDQSKLVSNNMIQIKKSAQRTNAEQSNKNIILGSAARAIAHPQLEIEANDVKCKHGAAMSKLNADQLFYMQSRGLDFIQTKNMLIQAFLA